MESSSVSASLIAEAAKGDPVAERRLYEWILTALRQIAAKRLGNSPHTLATPSSIQAEVALEVWERTELPKSKDDILRLLHKVVRRRIIDRWRRFRSQALGDSSAMLDPEMPTPEDVAIAHETLEDLLADLPPKSPHLETVVLRKIESKSNAEIAEELNVDPGTVSRYVKRIQDALARQVGEPIKAPKKKPQTG